VRPMSEAAAPYLPHRKASGRFVPLRGLRYHVLRWGTPALISPERPALVMLHGWMDVAASFQFVVDALAGLEGETRFVIAPDWRGFGLTATPNVDSYWFPDYLGDLDALLDAWLPGQPVDLLGHSMGGNVAMVYAGVRPQRIRRLVNLEGFGLPETWPQQAPHRYAQWLDELKAPEPMRSYASVAAVAERLAQNNPRLSPDKAAWLAPHWARQGDDGQWHILGNPAHKRVNPVLYRKDEAMAAWQQIAAPVLWVEGELTQADKWWGKRYPRADFEARLAVVPGLERHLLAGCGHMLHHDQPQALAARIQAFLA
jgi:pimeloyl-ACP methyl ester carboxylesterase